MTENTEHRVKFLDAWRFIAVCLVIQSHLLIFSGISLIDQYKFVGRLGRFGALGVYIFFFISGYVICTGLLLEYKFTRRVSLMAFYTRRFFRITPPLMLYLSVLYLLAKCGFISIANIQLINSALYLCNLNLSCSWYAGHTWSLAYEEQFYLIFPLLFCLLFWKLERAKLFIVIWLGMITFSVLFKFIGFEWAGEYFNNMIFILTGVVVALYRVNLHQMLSQTTHTQWFIACICLILIVGLLPFQFETYVSTLIYPILIAYIVLATPTKYDNISVFFENTTICHLGRISYTVYLWQQLATARYIDLASGWYFAMLIGVWIFAHYSFKWFETPLIRFASQLSRSIKDKHLLKSIGTQNFHHFKKDGINK